jgi:hypothetical protein
MGVTLWIDTTKDDGLELGGTIPVYQAFTEMQRLVGQQRWQMQYPALGGVLTQCEWQRDADPDWLAEVRRQAQKMLDRHREGLSQDAQNLLANLATAGLAESS